MLSYSREHQFVRSQPPAPARRRVLGLDLGKATDFTALTVLDWTDPNPAAPRPDYHVTALRRWPLATPYTDIAAWLVRYYRQDDPARRGWPPPALVVDETGVGAPVVEMIRDAFVKARVDGRLVAVTITAGSAVTLAVGQPGRWRVAKKQLASVLVTLFQSRRLQMVDSPEAQTLIREAQAFSVKITPAGNETFESWREGEHDDLVLSLGLACWAAVWIDWRRAEPWPPSPPPPLLCM